MKILVIAAYIFCSFNLTAQPPSANVLMQNAYEKASKEHKKVFVMFHASWCVWCHRMDSSMNDAACKKFFEDNYVVVHVTVMETMKNKKLENPDGDLLYKKYNGDKGAGLPFWLVFDQNGNKLGDSFHKKEGSSEMVGIGCPATKDEVDAFIAIIKRTSKLKEKELSVIASRFRLNEQ